MGERLRQARGTRPGTDVAAAVTRRLGGQETVSQSALSYYETGRSVPSLAKQRALETELGLPRGTIARDLGLLTDADAEGSAAVTLQELIEQARSAIERLANETERLERQVRQDAAAGRRADRVVP